MSQRGWIRKHILRFLRQICDLWPRWASVLSPLWSGTFLSFNIWSWRHEINRKHSRTLRYSRKHNITAEKGKKLLGLRKSVVTIWAFDEVSRWSENSWNSFFEFIFLLFFFFLQVELLPESEKQRRWNRKNDFFLLDISWWMKNFQFRRLCLHWNH